ncbi:hypothetical protein ACFV2X_16665 [Streptomyces sp. NPDC059679]|uniref:hypothetical protein n=1 Tax=Streptomyces sp. NPDC059679 TaxID=3346903 RepID=UPI0036886F4F
MIHDYCSGGHGVKAWLWWYNPDGSQIYYGAKYNGNGEAGAGVVWDPFADYGNVDKGEKVALKVCLVDGSGASTGTSCREGSHVSEDG